MKKTVSLFLLPLLLATAAFADDQIRSVQAELKAQGFFYGDVNGQASPETTAALRRYQIRNGLEVTGTLTKETLDALHGAGKSAPQVAPPPAPATPAPAKKPPVNLHKDESVEDADRAFLEREEARRRTEPDAYISPMPAPPTVPRDSSVVRPPAPLDSPGDDFPVLFARTPYATAPRAVQQQTLLRAQRVLAGRGFYRDVIDGLPGLATEEALLTYQRAARLTLTGRLDLETLSTLGLLPGRSTTRTEPPPAPAQRVYRGIWVN